MRPGMGAEPAGTLLWDLAPTAALRRPRDYAHPRFTDEETEAGKGHPTRKGRRPHWGSGLPDARQKGKLGVTPWGCGGASQDPNPAQRPRQEKTTGGRGTWQGRRLHTGSEAGPGRGLHARPRRAPPPAGASGSGVRPRWAFKAERWSASGSRRRGGEAAMEPAGSGGSSSVDSQAAFVLSNLAEVVERVLAFLPTKALLRVAGVSRLWKECVRRTLRSQQSVAWISTMEPGPPEMHSLVQVLAKELEKVHALPQTVLYMADEDTFVGEEDGHGHKKARKRNPQEIARAIEKLFPKRCHVLGVITPGVIVTPMGSGSNRPQEIEDGEAGFAILFPKIDGVKIETFHFLKDLRKCIHESKLIEAGLKNNPELRVVLIFGYNSWKIGAAGFLQKVVNILNEKSVMLAGGQVDRLTSLTSESNPPTNEACGVVGLSFSGPQIQSASVLLNQDVNDEKTAEAAMQRLKAANIPEYNTFGFMFACVGRGFQYYRTRRNVEADAFRKFFPNVPLFGFFGNGEIGCDRIVTGNFILRECNEVEDILLHSYTTVMILIHLGPTK